MDIGGTINKGIQTGAQYVNDNPWAGVAGMGALGMGAGMFGSHVLDKFEGPLDDEDPDETPEQRSRRRSIRRAIMASIGLIGAGGATAFAMGDRTGFDQGTWKGTNQLIGSILTNKWRQQNPLGSAIQHEEVHSQPAPLSTAAVPSENKLAALYGDDIAAFDKLASSLYFQNTIPLQSAVGTLMTDPHLSNDARYGLSSLFVDAAQAARSPLFSGADLARTAVRSGIGAIEGYGAGKLFGTIFALPPKQVTLLSRSGAIADAAYSSGLFR